MYFSFQIWPIVAALVAVTILTTRYLRLRNIPGPFITSFTDLWRVYQQNYNGPFSEILSQLHKKYGPIVRIGPNTVSVADAGAVETIYTLRGEFPKADSYAPLRSLANGLIRGSIIDMQDEKKNSQLKRSLGGIFALQHVMDYEQGIDEAVEVLTKRLATDHEVELFRVLQQFQASFLMKAAFGEETSFLEKNEDVSTLCFQSRNQHWVRWQGLPILEHFIYKTWFFKQFAKVSRPPPWIAIGLQKLLSRKDSDSDSAPARDLLSKYIEASLKHGEMMDNENLMRMISSTISAGFDTTAMTMTTMLFFMMKEPLIYRSLQREIEDAVSSKASTNLTFAETGKLRYLDAVMKEAMRCWPVLTLPLERCVPSDGAMICEKFLPGGTYVGCHPVVVHHDRHCFGDDVDRFNPSRWLTSDASKVAAMERASLGFGSGKRICLGRHLAELEIKKAIPTLLLKFKVKLLDENAKLESSDNLTSFPKPIMVAFEGKSETFNRGDI